MILFKKRERIKPMNIEFKITDRNGEKVLWANDKRIWDLKPSEVTENVKKAIISATYIGIELMKKEICQLDFGQEYFQEFKNDNIL